MRNSISAFLFTVTFAWCPPGLSNLTILSCPGLGISKQEEGLGEESDEQGEGSQGWSEIQEMRSCCVA
ncbi:ZNF559-ZNF177 readthrough [Homo sapiens]|nr:ZNF559-ZNF177 readthrough [Homo sapiens]KAI4040190.1 ZNF559-ZNF177 readthrough [Homo sapiens]